MNPNRPTQVRRWWMGAGVAVVALVSVLWWWTGTGGSLLLVLAAVFARAFIRLSRDEQRQQGQEDFLARRFRNVLAPESSCPMPLYYDGWNLIEERDSTGAVVASYVHGANVDEMLMMTRGGTNYFYHADALGSVTHLSDATGAVIEKYRYDVFGQPTILTADSQPLTASAFGNRFLFTGREYLAALGLYDYRHRIYMPMIGRFLQTDPIRFDAGDVNLYRYGGNNPVELVDPFGLTPTCASKSDMGNTRFHDKSYNIGIPGQSSKSQAIVKALKIAVDKLTDKSVGDYIEKAGNGAWIGLRYTIGGYVAVTYDCCLCDKGGTVSWRPQPVYDQTIEGTASFHFSVNTADGIRDFMEAAARTLRKTVEAAEDQCKIFAENMK